MFGIEFLIYGILAACLGEKAITDAKPKITSWRDQRAIDRGRRAHLESEAREAMSPAERCAASYGNGDKS